MSTTDSQLSSLRIDRDSPPARKPGAYLRWIALVVVAGLCVSGAVAAYSSRTQAVAVELIRAEGGSAPPVARPVLTASGYVVARRQATVSAKLTGKVAEILVEEGATAQQGELLARLDDTSVRPALALAESQLQSARNALIEAEIRMQEAQRARDRAERLQQARMVSEAELDAAHAQAQALTARVKTLRSEIEVAASTVKIRAQDLADLEVRAPFAGVVVSQDAQPGEIVSPMSAGGGFTRTGIATIVDMSTLEIEVDVNESFINHVRAGQRSEAVLEAYPNWTIPSHVIKIVPMADRQKATVRVRIGFDELDARLLPDMGVKVNFLEEAPQASVPRTASMRLPARAIQRDGDALFVWRVRGEQVERVTIRVAAERDGLVEVVAGLAAGDVVAKGIDVALSDGVRIKSGS
jgi:RND family efflux transporter MFP subunit